ncbi:cysteine dioxygenase [Aspergillus udagawae]|uniref:Cysteine dioxygenase n=1 Tax=Aspergillus udagawae TaxID=91492 RepID=A0A8H3NMG0_9EURO|nr:cysteine dioxygenase [Aspergillus udagawae]
MGSAHDFFDPFFVPSDDEALTFFSDISPWVAFAAASDGVSLPIEGQGTIAVLAELEKEGSLTFTVQNEQKTVTLTFTAKPNSCNLQFNSSSEEQILQEEIPLTLIPTRVPGDYIFPQKKIPYWLSIDKNYGRIRFGTRMVNNRMTLVEAQLKEKKDKGVWEWKEKQYKVLEKLKIVKVEPNEKISQTRINRLPVVRDLPPVVASTDGVTLGELDSGTRVVFADLPTACQTLYHNVAGPKIVLNTSEFPDFYNAIHRSVITPGCWAYNKLKEKSKDHDPANGYLRVTVGPNMGNSPGVPYVMEIWPPGNSSPIHDHGNASAIIKVLEGQIDCTYYDSIDVGKPIVIGSVTFNKGAVTWLGEKQYQIHMLKNKYHMTCVTIQCYRYEDSDDQHSEFFRFIKDNKITNFAPNSDIQFSEFEDKMRHEWDQQ